MYGSLTRTLPKNGIAKEFTKIHLDGGNMCSYNEGRNVRRCWNG